MSTKCETIIKRKGFGNAADFFNSRPRKTLFDLSEELGNNIAPIELLSTLRNHCRETQNDNFFCRILFVCIVYDYFPKGIGLGSSLDRLKAYSAWTSSFPSESKEEVCKVWQEMEEKMKKGWLPANAEGAEVIDLFSDKRISC